MQHRLRPSRRPSWPFFAVYNAGKWAVEGYSAGIRTERASSGVDVVVVEPGPFTTELFPQAPAPADADGRAAAYPAALHEAFEGMGAAFYGEVMEAMGMAELWTLTLADFDDISGLKVYLPG